MTRWFNTAGPCRPERHYMLNPADRLPQVVRLIDREGYFVIHAPRQIGKTTAILSLANQLTTSGKYTAIVLSVEIGAPFDDDFGAAENAILATWRDTSENFLPLELQPPDWGDAPPGQQIRHALQRWTKASQRPLVIFIDEIDALHNQTLLSVLRQLRDGYFSKPQGFPASVGLIGLRDVRDYKVASGGSDRLNTASPFNIKAESFTLQNFTQQEVTALYQQHTDDTGQVFTPAATQLAFELTQGQPWLVNALARQLVEVVAPEPSTIITPAMVEEAKEILIRRQDTHLDSLAERLRENRIKAIIQPMLAGLELGDIPNEDIQFIQDIGLCRMDPQGGLVIANPIYREVLPRVLTVTPMASLPQIAPSWLTAAGELDIDRLLHAFLDFWLQHGEAMLKSASYPEIAPHLVMMAFLHRVINGSTSSPRRGGGTLEREYAIGRDRIDLFLRYGAATLGIELKVWRTDRADPLKKGLPQLEGYLNRLRPSSGWLVIFDRRDNALPLEDRLSAEPMYTASGHQVMVIRA
jgi:ATPase family associated with various cellular activities (AAA)